MPSFEYMNFIGYDYLKKKIQKVDRTRTHAADLTLYLMSMFDWTELPETVDPRSLEVYMITEGMAAITKAFTGEWIAARAEYCDMPDVTGRGKNLIVRLPGHDPDSEDKRLTKIIKNWRESKDVVVFENNSLYTPDYDIGWRSGMLTEVDISEKVNVINTRYHTMLQANTDKEKAQIDMILDNMDLGKPQTIVAGQTILDGDSDIKAIPITDVDKVDRLQYLTHFRQDLMTEFFTKYGQYNNSTSKMAQQSVDEINGSLTNSFIIPFDRLKNRQKALERFNEIAGTSAAVDFSYPWLAQLAQIQQQTVEDPEDPDDSAEIVDRIEEEEGGNDNESGED